MDEDVLDSIGRALKRVYRCEPVDQLPQHWLALLQRLDEAVERGRVDPHGCMIVGNGEAD